MWILFCVDVIVFVLIYICIIEDGSQWNIQLGGCSGRAGTNFDDSGMYLSNLVSNLVQE